MCPPALYCCVRLCLAILYICLPALDVAGSSFDFEKHKLFGVYGGVICLQLPFMCLPGWVLVVGFPRLACLPLPLICLPVLFICLPGTSFHLSPRLGACGWVPGWLVSPTSFHLSPSSFHLSVTVGVRPFPLAMQHFYSSPRSVTAGVRPFPLAMQHFYSSPRSVTAGVRPCPLAMLHFYSCVSQACHWWCPPFSAGHATFLCICFPGLSLALPPFSAGHVAFLFICLPSDFFLFVFQVWCLHCCVRLCLAILYICLPALDVAGSSFDFEKHKLFGVYGGVI